MQLKKFHVVALESAAFYAALLQDFEFDLKCSKPDPPQKILVFARFFIYICSFGLQIFSTIRRDFHWFSGLKGDQEQPKIDHFRMKFLVLRFKLLEKLGFSRPIKLKICTLID